MLVSCLPSNSHLPAYLVAAFIKRLSRLALTAPPEALLMVIPFICNLFRRHPACKVLVHRPNGPGGKGQGGQGSFGALSLSCLLQGYNKEMRNETERRNQRPLQLQSVGFFCVGSPTGASAISQVFLPLSVV